MYNVITEEQVLKLMERYDRLLPDQQIALEQFLAQLCNGKESDIC